MAQIVTGKGIVLLVDDEDLARCQKFTWHVAKGYPAMNLRLEDGRRRLHYLHREVLGLKVGDGHIVDHINGDRLDARKSNLRVCTNSENLCNRGKTRANKSGYKGVSWDARQGQWRATCIVKQKQYFLGYFSDPAEAYVAYCNGASRLHGDFVNFGG